MTRFTCFTDGELNDMESAFCTGLDNSELAFRSKKLENLTKEIRAERGLREKAEMDNFKKQDKIKELHEDLVSLIRKEIKASNSHYGMARSCDDDEKLVVLCMINKTLEDIQGTLEGMQEALARVDDKI